VPVLVQDQLDGRRKLEHRDVRGPVPDLVAHGAHHLGAGDVRRGVHALARGAAAVQRLQAPVLELVEVAAQVEQPLDHVRRLGHQGLDEGGLVLEMPAADHVEVVDAGRVLVALGGGLDAALGHHGVGVAVAELGGQDHLGALLLGEQGGRAAGAAAADDEHVRLVLDLGQVDLRGVDAALRLEQVHHLVGDVVALGRAHLDLAAPFVLGVGMELFQDLGPFLE
jgi:hypothetical protein